MNKAEIKNLEKEIKGDQELYSYFVQRNQFLCEDNFQYLSKHPEIKQLLSDFLSNCLIHKPDDIFKFTKEYYTKFSDNPDVPRLVIVVGPSGVGKGTLIKRLIKDVPEKIQYAISHTTRPKKETETDNNDYYFVSQDEFLKMINKESFIEYNLFNNDYYGISKKEVERISELGKICLLEIDINGAKKIYHSEIIEAVYIAVFPTNIEELRERLRKRGEDSVEEINRRLKLGQEEITEMKNSNIFNFNILNDDFDIAYSEFKSTLDTVYPELNTELMGNISDLNTLLSEYENKKENEI